MPPPSARSVPPERARDTSVRSIGVRPIQVADVERPGAAHGQSEDPPRRSAAQWATEAEEAGQKGELGSALAMWQEAWDSGQNVAFRLWVESRVKVIVASHSEARLRVESSRLAPGARLRALVDLRRAELLVVAGREQRARAVIDGIVAGLEPEERQAIQIRAGYPDTFGALLPLTGPLGPLGREILQGMVLAAGLVGRSRGAMATVLVADSEKDAQGGARTLARSGVTGILGLPQSRRARQAAPVCQAEGVPLITAADGHGVSDLGTQVFRGVHAPVARARALAAWLAGSRPGARVVVAHPANAYGRRTGGAFDVEARRLGLTVVDRISYPPTETNLYPLFRSLVSKTPEAVFVADSAHRLEIVAPQLALAGLGPKPSSAERRGHGSRRDGSKTVLLLSTAEGVDERLVKNVGHAVEGAMLAPGFFPDPRDPSVAAFVTAYHHAYGRSPGRYAAFGYLWLLELRSLLVGRAWGRISLHRAMTPGGASSQGASGPQGRIRQGLFDARGERLDAPRLYQVKQGIITRVASPVLRPMRPPPEAPASSGFFRGIYAAPRPRSGRT